jgi:hypothetical protein
VAMGVAIGLSPAAPAIGQTQASFSKTANPTSGVAPLTVLYTYTFDNTQGPRALSSVDTPTDDKCSPVVFRGGDTNQNQVLDIGERWTWTCTSVTNATTTNMAQTSARYTTCEGEACTLHILDFITARATVTVPILAVTISGRTSACKDDVVTLTAVPTAGTPPYSYTWTTGATAQSITADTSAAGTFNFGVTVRDSQARTASASTTLNVAAFCLTEATPRKEPPDFPLLTTIEWGCRWSFAGRCLSRTIVKICVGGRCLENPISPVPEVCPRCDLVVGVGVGGVVGFLAGALLIRARRNRSNTTLHRQ